MDRMPTEKERWKTEIKLKDDVQFINKIRSSIDLLN